MNIKIHQIDHNSKYLNDVIALGDANKRTLGLFPKEAYKESASKKRVIVAVDEDTDALIGYLLFSTSRRKMLVPIVHLCVSERYRGQGAAKLLFKELKKITQDGYLGVRVHCRVDYPANKLWPKLGFVAVDELKGRGKKVTRLTVWKYEYPHQSLFSYASLQNENARVKVVIDANVFYQLQNPDDPDNEESLPLLEPWLDIDLCITPEMFNEIARNKDENKRALSRKFARSFISLEVNTLQNEFQNIYLELRPLFPETLKISDESDLKQLAYAISARVPFFVTRDEPILDKADDIFEKFDIQILRPSDLILMQDELLRGDDYTPSRLAGSRIRTEKVRSQQSERLVELFLSSKGESKGEFNRKLQMVLSSASNVETFVVFGQQEEELGLISYSRQKDNQITVPVFRVGRDPICQYIAQYLVNNLILTASAEKRTGVKIHDKYLSERIISSLRENGFLKNEDAWYKVALPETLNKDDLKSRLTNNDWTDETKKALTSLVEVLQAETSQSVLLDVEKSLWPLKLQEVDIPAFIVPIRPVWAMHLFDTGIAGQDLFGGEPSLILNAENVYYRAAHPKVLSAPGRILWYVSSGEGRYQGSMQIKASSYLDDVEIGKPKQLFSKYKKLGIYKWNDVFKDVAGGDLNKDIMAFKFSKTEVFSRPISLVELQEMWKTDGKNFNNAVSPLAINKERFLEIYNLGMKGRKDEK